VLNDHVEHGVEDGVALAGFRFGGHGFHFFTRVA
jgi:hypothetical protein